MLILQSDYIEILKDIQQIPKTLPKVASIENIDFKGFTYPPNGNLTNPIEDIEKIVLNPDNEYLVQREVYAYDESIKKYSCLEGEGYLTAHSLVHLGEYDYNPKGLI